jgi:hypothetical protein
MFSRCRHVQIHAARQALMGIPTDELAAAQFATGFKQPLLGFEMNERLA